MLRAAAAIALASILSSALRLTAHRTGVSASAPAMSSQVAEPSSRCTAVVEFLLVGGLTPLCFAVSWLLRESLGLEAAELAVGFAFFHLAFVLNDPHFSVTYFLFYQDFKERAFGPVFPRALRIRYLLAGVLVPVVLVAWGVGSVASGSAEGLGLLIELMFLLVGWHYVKQGFGVMMVLSVRRKLRFSKLERWVLLAHCFAGWAYAWANPHKAARLEQVKGVIYMVVPRPYVAELVALGALSLTAAALLLVLVAKRRREGPLPLFTPLTALLFSVWAWMAFASVDPLVLYMAPALHSLQYLYFVWLLKRNEAKSRTGEPWFESPRQKLGVLAVGALGLGWLLFHGAPEALDAMFADPPKIGLGTSLGPTPYFAGLYAFVNLHHYFMDNVIWRRENPQTRFMVAP